MQPLLSRISQPLSIKARILSQAACEPVLLSKNMTFSLRNRYLEISIFSGSFSTITQTPLQRKSYKDWYQA